ncbi:AI-2E family transporter [Porcincola intestinalis]|uniref:AI-2E family transporter n=1 Tax=Porcincola intestinalis TaxID=2606632 RepID=UPI0023F3367E|nr:AI-2E family transporter [Porcincola intestinalis]MCI6766680.1 AI-2E family transporter [Lachnospiraceae bacterium]MDD7060962.1 AI-2E family transporter [Porcincola intestinalis]MDY5283393.1 AI-2E family transporter [Porcincola intestinalis]MDY5578427.1 AI-2E family transporter [Porcincola intestinalis]
MDKDQKKDQKKDGQTIETDGLKENPGVKGAAADAGKGTPKQEKHFRDRIPNNHRYSVISFYVVFTVVVIFILVRIGDNLDKIALALGAGFHWMRVIFVPLALGFALAYLFAPIVRFFRRRLEKLPYYRKRNKSGLGAAVGITFLIVAAALALGLTFLISAFTHELTVVSFDSITNFINGISKSFNEVYIQLKKWSEQMNISSDALATVTDTITSWAGNLASQAGRAVSDALSHLTGYLANGAFAVIFAVYFSLDADGLKRYWKRFFRSVFPEKATNVMRTAVRDADRVFSGYIRGQLLDALFMMVVVSIALLLLNVKFAVIIGVLTGIGNLVPYVGPFVAYGCTGFVGIMSQDWKKLIVSIIVVFIIQTIDGNIVNPKLLSHAVKVHPMLVIIALLLGSKIGGLGGMILAVPVAALLKVWLDRWVGIMEARKLRQKE